MNELAEAPSENGQEPLTQEYVEQTIHSAIPESDLKYLGEDEQPEKVVEKTDKTKKAAKPEIGDSEIPLDDDEPEKVVEGEQEEDDENPPAERNETEKARAKTMWKQYREAYRESPKLKQENETLKRQVAQLGDQSQLKVLQEHVQALSTERERLIRLVEQGNIEQSEVWSQQVMGPLNQMWDDVQTISKRNGMDPTHVAKLLQNGDDVVLQDYMDEHSTRPGDRNYLFGMIRDISNVERTKEYLRAHSHELSQKSHQELVANQQQYFQNMNAQRTSAVEKIIPKVTEKILNVLPRDKRRDLKNDAKYILDFDNWEPDIQMFAGVSAVVLPDLLDSYNMLRSQLKEAKTELVRLRGGAPRITTGSRAPRAPIAEEEEPAPAALAKTDLSDFAEQSTQRIRQAMGYRK
jgi:hypothetical protein